MPDEYHTVRKERLCQDGEVPVAGPGCCEVPSDGPIRVVPRNISYGLSGPGASSTGLVFALVGLISSDGALHTQRAPVVLQEPLPLQHKRRGMPPQLGKPSATPSLARNGGDCGLDNLHGRLVAELPS